MATGLFSTMKPNFDLTADANKDWFDGQLNQLSSIAVEPLISGYAFVKWLKVPSWLLKAHPYFKELTEKNLVSFEGNEDISLETVSMTQGFSKTESAFAGGIAALGNTFTMNHNEYSGSPVARSYGYWTSSIRDPRTNIAIYPSYGVGEEYKYNIKNHSGILLYAKTRPDFNSGYGASGLSLEAIEYASLYTFVVPTKILLSHQNFEAGTNDKAGPLSMEFTGKKIIGDEINRLALTCLQGINNYKHMNDSAKEYFNEDGTLKA
jgi:hypothetical protein